MANPPSTQRLLCQPHLGGVRANRKQLRELTMARRWLLAHGNSHVRYQRVVRAAIGCAGRPAALNCASDFHERRRWLGSQIMHAGKLINSCELESEWLDAVREFGDRKLVVSSDR